MYTPSIYTLVLHVGNTMQVYDGVQCIHGMFRDGYMVHNQKNSQLQKKSVDSFKFKQPTEHPRVYAVRPCLNCVPSKVPCSVPLLTYPLCGILVVCRLLGHPKIPRNHHTLYPTLHQNITLLVLLNHSDHQSAVQLH